MFNFRSIVLHALRDIRIGPIIDTGCKMSAIFVICAAVRL